MSDERWTRAKALFQQALQHPPEQRSALLARHVADPDALEDARILLASHEQDEDFLRPPMSADDGAPAADPLLGRDLGGFVLTRRIGTGGMGAVYEAQQQRPARRAAVKVLRSAFVTPRLLRRFEFEAELLARLRHPGIAAVYAAGTFEVAGEPQPWLAMELVDGERLDVFARRGALPARERIELLLRVCDAVQHAHERGVIHRDLKPANILVTTEPVETAPGASSAQPRPRVLDFGVARAMERDAADPAQTLDGEVIGTLGYMSPEQLLAGPEPIDARVDVYALGVIGYELLAGRLPHAQRSSISSAIRSLELDLPRPLGALIPALRGDVEAIFAKALETDRERRYATVAELAADLRRYLTDEPVRARRITPWVAARKFARRNRALVLGTLATVAGLTLGLVLYAREAAEARREAAATRYEADKAVAVNDFIANDFLVKLIAAANALEPGERLPVAELIERSASSIEAMFAPAPLLEAAVRNEVATVHYNVGSYEPAAAHFSRALSLWESNLGPDHPDTLKAVNNLAMSLARLGRAAEAEALYRRALQGRERVLGPDDPFTLVTLNNLAELIRGAGRVDEAEPLLRRALEVQRRVHGPGHKNTLTTQANLASLLLRRGQTDEALRMHRDVHERCVATFGPEHVMTLQAGTRLAQTLQRVGETDAALALAGATHAGFSRLFGPTDGGAITARRLLSRIHRDAGGLGEARRQLETALAELDADVGSAPELRASVQRDLDALAVAASAPSTAPATATSVTPAGP